MKSHITFIMISFLFITYFDTDQNHLFNNQKTKTTHLTFYIIKNHASHINLDQTTITTLTVHRFGHNIFVTHSNGSAMRK